MKLTWICHVKLRPVRLPRSCKKTKTDETNWKLSGKGLLDYLGAVKKTKADETSGKLSGKAIVY